MIGCHCLGMKECCYIRFAYFTQFKLALVEWKLHCDYELSMLSGVQPLDQLLSNELGKCRCDLLVS